MLAKNPTRKALGDTVLGNDMILLTLGALV